MKKIRKKVYDILKASDQTGSLSWFFDVFLVTIISLNVLAIILESVKPIYVEYHELFQNFELFSVAFFSIEYVLRVWTAVEDERFQKPIQGRIRYGLTFLGLVDLLAVLPFYLSFFVDLRFIRVLRLFRLFRLFKMARYLSAISIIESVVRQKKHQLVVSIVFILFMLLFTSCLMYYIEGEAQPEVFSSIPETMWWGVETFTTVGYGDVYPITPIGKTLGGLIAILGIGLFALPTGILAAGFSQALDEKGRSQDGKCPVCGR